MLNVTPHIATSYRTRLVSAVVLGAAAGVCGCAKKQAHLDSGAGAVGSGEKALPGPATAPSDLERSPVARATDNGLEAAWWVVTSSDEEIGQALASHLAASLPVDANVAALWEANGLRMVTIPLDQLEAVQSQLSMVGAIQRQWLGQTPSWTDTITGPAWTRSRTIVMDAGRLTLGPGRMRILTRCWTVPVPVAPSERDPSPAAALHIEMLLQHKEAEHAANALATEMPGATDALEAGLVFRRLLAEMTVTQGDAYLIVPYKPGVPWGGEKAEPAAEPAKEADSTTLPATEPVPKLGEVRRGAATPADATSSPSASGGASVGPPEAPAITIGEALLTNDGVRQPTTFNPDPGTSAVWRAERPARAILILIPRVPDRFRLIDTTGH